MAQVMQRPESSASQRLLANLPEIPHPASRLGNPIDLKIDGAVHFAPRPGSHPTARAADDVPFTTHRRSATGSQKETNLPEIRRLSQQGIPVARAAEVQKPKIPIFGNKAEMTSRSDAGSRMSVRSAASAGSEAGAQEGLQNEVEELEIAIQDKLRDGYFAMRQAFVAADPEGKGALARDSVHRLIMSFMGRYISAKLFNHLLAKINLGGKSVIRYEEFYACFRKTISRQTPDWMHQVRKRNLDKTMMSANQVHTLLKEKAKQKFSDVGELIPQFNPGGSGRIIKPELYNVLNQMGYYLDNDEFEKLWKKYDPENIGVVKGPELMKKLGISFRTEIDEIKYDKDQKPAKHGRRRQLTQQEIDRAKSLDVERWLKKKFRQGFVNMKESCEKFDTEKSGTISKESFRKVLDQVGLTLDNTQLSNFLVRIGEPEQVKKTAINYRDIINSFQDRSAEGLSQKIIKNPNHKFHNSRAGSPNSVVTELELKMMTLFQSDYMKLLQMFQKIDRYRRNTVSQTEFRAALESRFDIQITDEQFETLLDKLPLDIEGNVKFVDFMEQFDVKGVAPSAYENQSMIERFPNAIFEDDEDIPPVHDDDVDLESLNQSDSDYERCRSAGQLFHAIKQLLENKLPEIEKVFFEMDTTGSRRITQKYLHELLKKFHVNPVVSYGEIRNLWDTFILNNDKTMDYLQFVRHFLYNKDTSAFPNAKILPPQLGDADLMKRSLKLNSTRDLLYGSLNNKIDVFWDNVRKEFKAIDTRNSGFVKRHEFMNVLTELCVQLNHYELNELADKFDLFGDGRVNFLEFLKPYAMKKSTGHHANIIVAMTAEPRPKISHTPELPVPPQSVRKPTSDVASRIRKKVSGDVNTIRKSFRKLDSLRTGALDIAEFRAVLRLHSIILDDDEAYHVVNNFDRKLEGTIEYELFLKECQ